jgi:crotonobetainyl-CoA:carnitine CoA-transferase CaiB-like acyl-CoA transferase
MVDGAAMILGPFFSAFTNGFWGERGTNHLDGGAHFYNVYETADHKWISVGAIEPQFYAELVHRLGVADDALLQPAEQNNRKVWAAAKQRMADAKKEIARPIAVCGTEFQSIAEFAKATDNYRTTVRRWVNSGNWLKLEEAYRANFS